MKCITVLIRIGHPCGRSGLTAETFRRRSSFVEFSQEDLAETREAIETFGKLEGLDAHAYAATVRFE